MQLLGAKPAPQVIGVEKLPGKSNYFIGNNPKKWRTNVPTYARVKYANVYPGVDLVYYGNQGQLEYDFVVQPGADPSRIALDIEASLVSAPGRPRGAPLRVAENGDLVMGTDGSEVVFRKPVVYQPATDSGQRTRDIVEGKYVIRADQQVTFDIASYDKMRPLVIDPTLVYSTYLGGSNDDEAAAIAVDAAGNAYVTGATNSSNFPTTVGALQTATPGNIFVSKLNAAGSALLYSTYLGSNEGERSSGIAVDAAGNVYVTGETSSSDFPTTPGAFQTTLNNGAAFVSKLNAAGSALVYSTYLGLTFTGGSGIAVDAAGHAYVTGGTSFSNFPTTPGAFQTTLHSSGGNAFVAKLTPDGTALVYATYLGGSGTVISNPPFPPSTFGDTALGIAIDAAGNAYVTGGTTSSDFPITSDAFQPTFGGGVGDAFVSKLNATGSTLLYSTYLGGSDIDNGTGIAVGAAGNAYITGYSFSSNFPTTPSAFQTTFFGEVVDAFVAKIMVLTFAGTPGRPNCHGKSVSALARQFGGLDAAASALGFPSVQALQDAIREFCEE
jgi:hypothetical protein